jgi:hypothetical protein
MVEGRNAAERCQVIQGKKAVMAEQGSTHLWATAVLVHGDPQLQRLVPSHLNDVADSMLDFFSRELLLGIALRIVNPAILTHQDWAVLKRLNPP